MRLRPLSEAAQPADAASSAAASASTFSSSSAAAPLDLPLDSTPAQLSALVNALRRSGGGEAAEDASTRPFSFYLNGVEVLSSLRAALAEQGLSAESAHTVHYSPLAAFRVAPVARCTDSLPGHGEPILHVSFAPDGGALASGGGDATVRFWDVRTATPRHVCAGHAAHVLCTAWSPDGSRFASADKAGVVRVWDPARGVEACRPLTGHKAWVGSLA